MVADQNTATVLLPGYGSQLGDDAVQHSRRKLQEASEELKNSTGTSGNDNGGHDRICTIRSFPCESNAETLGYRCKCSFQIIYDQESDKYQYAMRQNGEPVSLGSTAFPIANPRIQLAMQRLWEDIMNATIVDENGLQRRIFTHVVDRSLASLTIAASWGHFVGVKEDNAQSCSDCIMTLNYDSPLEEKEKWENEAQDICQLLNLTQLHGRSKGRMYSAKNADLTSFLRDTIILSPPTGENNKPSSWGVSLATGPPKKQEPSNIFVNYHKPETAFFHPNANVMCQALVWMLNRISVIATSSERPLRLLEMYCGCGAHTLALSKSGLLASIQAVELDQRLVDACKANIDLNGDNTTVSVKSMNPLSTDTSAAPPTSTSNSTSMTPIRVAQGDAGKWASRLKKRSARNEATGIVETDENFNILLVDPPRQGLDDQVIDMAIHSEIEHLLIISCGHKALVRDMKVLCNHFEVFDCIQLDLFPRTDSVETLVHLKKRQPTYNR